MFERNSSAVYAHIEIDGLSYPNAVGVMFARPSSDTILASLDIPQQAKDPNLKVGQTIAMSFRIENCLINRSVIAEVKEIKSSLAGVKWYQLLMRRKKR